VWGAQVASCTPPPGYKVIASGPQAVVTSHEYKNIYDLPYVGWYGCLRAVGRQRLLKSAPDLDGSDSTKLEQVVLAGRFAAFSFFSAGKNVGCSMSVETIDVGAGHGSVDFDADCGQYSSAIDSLSVSSGGFAVWRYSYVPYPPVALTGVSCASVSLCVASDDSGNVATTTDPTGGRTAWSKAAVGSTNAVSCPSANLCVAVDSAGDVVTSSDPTGGAGAWNVSQVDPGKWLAAVSCPSVSLCVAVGADGDVISSTDPTGGRSAWTVNHVGNNQLTAISCPSSSLCVAADGAGDVITSSDPTGPPSTWTANHVDSAREGQITGISCPSASLCIATDYAGNLLTSTNPTGGAGAWSTFSSSRPLSAVSCASASLCVAVDRSGDVLTSTSPTAGTGDWNAAYVDNVVAAGVRASLNAIACPSSSLCVAVDDLGNAFTTTNPLGGASAWSSALIDGPASCTATPCVVEELYARDSQGTRLIDGPTSAGAANSLANITFSGNRLTWIHDGTPEQATLR
jgi:hypothetical protein